MLRPTRGGYEFPGCRRNPGTGSHAYGAQRR